MSLNEKIAELRKKYHHINQVLVISDREYKCFGKTVKSDEMAVSPNVPADNPFRTGYTYVELEKMFDEVSSELSKACIARRRVAKVEDTDLYKETPDVELEAIESKAASDFAAARTHLRQVRAEMSRRKTEAAVKKEVEGMSPEKLKALIKHAHTIGVDSVDSGEKVDGLK